MKSRNTFTMIMAICLVMGTYRSFAQTAEELFPKGIQLEEVKGELGKAIEVYQTIVTRFPANKAIASKALLHIGLCYEKLGEAQAFEARKAYERVVRDYADQTETVTLAKEKLTLNDHLSSGATPEAELSFKLASDLFKQLKYEQAVAEYEKVIKLAPKSQMAQEARLWIGHCYFKQGKNELALKSFKAIVKEYPGSNLVPVAELMIGQIKQSTPTIKKKNTTVVLKDNSILDTVTGIKFTKINTWAGKNDMIKSASSITDIFPNRKFLLSGNKVIPFENSESFSLNDSLYANAYSKLSPDGTKLAFLGKNSISLIPVTPVNGRPSGPAQKLLDITYQNGYGINWSPDGNNLIFSLWKDSKYSNWTFSTVDHKLKLITNPNTYPEVNAVYAKNGLNFLYQRYDLNGGFDIRMKSLEGKSVSILDSCLYQFKNFILSPDNKYILYTKMNGKKMIYRLSDRQHMELSPPEEVGDFVSWSDKENKAYSFCPSSVAKNTIKVASVFGGPVFELENLEGGYTIGWAKNSGSLLVRENGVFGKSHLKIVNLTNQDTLSLDGIDNLYGYASLSPDGTKVMGRLNSQGKRDLSIIPVSLNDRKITGKPILIFKNFPGGSSLDYSWSPDGKSVAVCNQGDVYICSTEDGKSTQLTKTPVVEDYPDWSPDGNAISVYSSTNQLMILKATDGEVLMTQEKVAFCTWTPDGKDILIAFEDGQLNAVSIKTGKSRNIANWKEMSPPSIALDNLIYSPDGKKIIINTYQSRPFLKTYTFLLNVADGKITELAAEYDESNSSVRWSPDSKWISYSSSSKKRDRLESTLWEADLTDFMKKIKPGTEKGFTTDFDFKALALPAGGVPPDGTFTDSRDGHVYKYKKIGTQTWMTENLAYLPEVGPDSVTSLVDKRYYVYGYKGSDVKTAKNNENYQKYGVLYNWPAAVNGAAASNSAPSGVQGICPKGWHLPSDSEWMELERNLGMSPIDLELTGPRSSGAVGKKLKSPEGWDDDIFNGQSGFNALPGGVNSQGKSLALNYTVYFWTSSSLSDTKATYRNAYGPGVYRRQDASRGMGLSIRCIKD